MNRAAIGWTAAGCVILFGGWEAAGAGEPPVLADQPPQLRATARREDSRIHFVTAGNQTICVITSAFGIDRAAIQRSGKRWPAPLLIRLHLKGLESFKVTSGAVTVEWSVSSHAGSAARVTLRKGAEEQPLDSHSPYHSAVRFQPAEGDAEGNPPLLKRYFEVPLPAKLFEQNPEQIVLEWIDFYRG